MEADRVSHRRRCRPRVFDSGLRDRHGTARARSGLQRAWRHVRRGRPARAAWVPGRCPILPVRSSHRLRCRPVSACPVGHPHDCWPFGQQSCVFGCGHNSCVRQLRRSSRIVVSRMLTERQPGCSSCLAGNQTCSHRDLPRGRHPGNCRCSDRCEAYVSDSARHRYSTIAVASAWRFTRFFGCSIDDLFTSS